jgi:hypothetical protein
MNAAARQHGFQRSTTADEQTLAADDLVNALRAYLK